METTNIRVAKNTHKRLNFLKGKMGIIKPDDSTPTLDEIINAGLDLLETENSNGLASVEKFSKDSISLP